MIPSLFLCRYHSTCCIVTTFPRSQVKKHTSNERESNQSREQAKNDIMRGVSAFERFQATVFLFAGATGCVSRFSYTRQWCYFGLRFSNWYALHINHHHTPNWEKTGHSLSPCPFFIRGNITKHEHNPERLARHAWKSPRFFGHSGHACPLR